MRAGLEKVTQQLRFPFLKCLNSMLLCSTSIQRERLHFLLHNSSWIWAWARLDWLRPLQVRCDVSSERTCRFHGCHVLSPGASSTNEHRLNTNNLSNGQKEHGLLLSLEHFVKRKKQRRVCIWTSTEHLLTSLRRRSETFTLLLFSICFAVETFRPSNIHMKLLILAKRSLSSVH